MTPTLMSLLVAAIGGGVVSLALAWICYRIWGRPQLEATLAQVQDEFEQRVRKGVTDAATALMPELRAQVALGFRDALKDSHAAGIAEGTAKIVSGSTELVVDSLSNLLGLKKK